MQRTEKFIEVNAPVEIVFDLYSDFESFPKWMKSVREVRRIGRRHTRWMADAPFGMNVEWEAETTRFEPNRKVAWRTIRGDVEMEGEVTFQETRRGTTLMRVRVRFEPPAGRLGSLFARLFGSNPEQQMDEELHNFAQMAESLAERRFLHHAERYRETRRPSAHRAFAEQGRHRRSRREEIIRQDERAFREEMRRGTERGRDYAPSSYREEQPDWGESFDEALRHARRSQMESMRRYNEERVQAERRRRSRYYSDYEQRGAHTFQENNRRRRDFSSEPDDLERLWREPLTRRRHFEP